MTVQEILDNLSLVPQSKRHLPVIAIDTSSGVSYELSCYDTTAVAGKSDNAGILCDMQGMEYIRAYVE